MMISDRLLGLAFEYKKQKLWKILQESDVFGIRMEDGTAGYISILGQMGAHNALVLYIGDAGYDCLQRLTSADFNNMEESEFRELAMRNDCIHCAMESKDMLYEDELERTRAYAREHGIRIAGKNAYPHFLRYSPDCIPWKVSDEKDQEYIGQALEAALALSHVLHDDTKENVEDTGRFFEMIRNDELPCFEKQGDSWMLAPEPMEKPAEYQPDYPSPVIANELLIARLKKRKRGGKIMADVMRFVEAVQENDAAPYYPYFIVALNPMTDSLLPIKETRHLVQGAQILLEDFAQALIDSNMCPKEIQVMNDRSEAFFRNFCTRMKIRLMRKDSIPMLEDAEESFLETFQNPNNDELGFMIDLLESFSDEEVRNMPREVRTQVAELIDLNLLPEDLAQRLSVLLGL